MSSEQWRNRCLSIVIQIGMVGRGQPYATLPLRARKSDEAVMTKSNTTFKDVEPP
ncbi:hypothetical protein SERLADRAFT_456300 [Serpula lacrymans var. lacrymans S7.9]|uniref:Uncharacterized protein n=1 Tax=Serpula lacrymans var. lacrymans (strain S7.9) TaxID=578457 RepID=F8NI82_SERL9|nr:uncharacterized protein SERLADRAFT_456300 [Serpula lacrymans var. lacrymans S7.9]EGO28979.1 hypothetical protein SERLADRAFT_456300 [Serpula lacrymans var. lacrymans S7.9]